MAAFLSLHCHSLPLSSEIPLVKSSSSSSSNTISAAVSAHHSHQKGIHGDLEAAERTAKLLVQLDSERGGTYVLLSNIYSSLSKWEEAEATRDLMSDLTHPNSSKIYEMLDDMICRLKQAGYVPDKSEVPFDMDEEEKDNALSLHREASNCLWTRKHESTNDYLG
ncbi:E motif, partial [Dillenia turbinata]